jgi:putative tryptophan/tyrosine transport system substrate-binding protein
VSAQLKRREVITLLGAAVAWPLAARAQQSGKLPKIGLLSSGAPAVQGQWVAAFVQRLRELGWIEGRTVVLEVRWAEGRPERFTEIVAEFVRLKVEVIMTYSTAAVIAAKQATSIIPIIFAAANDPIGSGLVASLARPGGNVTGLSLQSTDIAAKRLELLREVVPGVRRLAMLTNSNNPSNVLESREIQEAAHSLALRVDLPEIQRAEDIAPAIEGLKGQVDALYVSADPLLIINRIRINTLANVARLPTITSAREWVEAGSLMSYGPSFADLFRRCGDIVDKILRGTEPADIPVEQPTKFDLVINLTTARVLGLTVPPTLLTRADEVIE